MNMYQAIQRSFQRKAGKVKRVSSYNSHKLNICYPFETYMQSFLKNVEITFMNRIFKGFGFLNDNGGLEFFSEDYKEKHCSVIRESIVQLRKEQKTLEEEKEAVQLEISRCNSCINDWLSQYEDLRSRLQKNISSMQDLVTQGKSGQIAEEKKLHLRQQLKTEQKHIESQMKSVKAEIDGYYRSKFRLFNLGCILSELQEKISSKEKDLTIINTFTIGQPGLLTFPRVKEIVHQQVNLFMDIFDYLAYVFLSNSDTEKLPIFCDTIILNDPRNFPTLLLNLVSYDRIHCYFPRSTLGLTMEKTIHQYIGPRRVMIMRKYYRGYTSIYEYAKTFDDFKPVYNYAPM